MISLTNAAQVLASTRASLGLAEASSVTEPLDEALLCALIRRVAGIYCPCSAATLARATRDALRGLLVGDEAVEEAVDAAIGDLVAWGDLLELTEVTSIDESLPRTALFAAPPSYISLKDGTLAISGLTEESALPLPEALRKRVEHRAFRRFIRGEQHEELERTLAAYGYREVDARAWLLQPDDAVASRFVGGYDRMLDGRSKSSGVDGLQVYDPSASKLSYRARWVSPTGRGGRFIGRRPQAYGQPLWCYVEVESGVAVRFIDLPLRGENYRGCDAAWRLQHALNAASGAPTSFGVRRLPTHGVFSFYYPLPLWAERRLSLFAARTKSSDCLFAFAVPLENLEAEASNLCSKLWLSRLDL